MSTIEQSVDALEQKLHHVLQKLDHFQKVNNELTLKLNKAVGEIENQQGKIVYWKDQYESLKMANTMLGSSNDKRETKLKINTLIRDIDHCITQLSK